MQRIMPSPCRTGLYNVVCIGSFFNCKIKSFEVLKSYLQLQIRWGFFTAKVHVINHIKLNAVDFENLDGRYYFFSRVPMTLWHENALF